MSVKTLTNWPYLNQTPSNLNVRMSGERPFNPMKLWPIDFLPNFGMIPACLSQPIV
jgi:hypothetical protein